MDLSKYCITREFKIKLALLGGLLAVLAADVRTTTAILSLPGGVELNPFMVPFVSSPALMIIAKLCCVCIILSMALLCRLACRKYSVPIRGDLMVVAAATSTSGILVANNLLVLI